MQLILMTIIVLSSCVLVSGNSIQADALLREVTASLPQEQLNINGDITARKRRGIVVNELLFEMLVNWGSEPAVASYSIQNMSGANMEQLTLTRHSDGRLYSSYTRKDQPSAMNKPNLFDTIQGTDITWIDLTLSFLWWPNGAITGSDEIKGRTCLIVKIPAPKEQSHNYSYVLLWIDQAMPMLLQAEGYNAENELIRRMWVKSLKKINDKWMIKDLEIQSFPSSHRTRLRIREVNEGH